MKLINGELLTEDECYEKHYRLIYQALKPFLFAKNLGVDREDLISEGNIGFMKAYRDFDDSLGFRFSSFAVRKIKFEAMRYIRDKGNSIKYSRSMVELADKINIAGIGHYSESEIAKELNVTEKEIHDAFESMKKVDSLNQVVFQENDKVTLLDQLGQEADFTSVYVNDFIDKLDPVEKTIINMRLEDYKQRVIGEEIGVSQMQVSRRLKKIGEKYMEVM